MLMKKRQGFPAPPEIAEIRKALAGAVASGNWRTAVRPVEDRIEGVRVLRYRSGQPRGTMLHFHGGGYRLGCPELGAFYATRIAIETGVEVVCASYSLSPEAPFPNALLEGLAILRSLADNGPGVPLFVSGESAGGGLAASLVLLAAEQGINPDGVILLSPWLDLRVNAASYEANAASDRLFSYEAAKAAAELYLQDLPPDTPFASALLADIQAFPPTFIAAGTIEVLVDDSRLFAQKLSARDLKVTYMEVADMEHVAVTRDMNATGSEQVARGIERFLQDLLESRQASAGER